MSCVSRWLSPPCREPPPRTGRHRTWHARCIDFAKIHIINEKPSNTRRQLDVSHMQKKRKGGLTEPLCVLSARHCYGSCVPCAAAARSHAVMDRRLLEATLDLHVLKHAAIVHACAAHCLHEGDVAVAEVKLVGSRVVLGGSP